MQIIRDGKKFTAIFGPFNSGLAGSEFQVGNFVAPGTYNVDYLTESGVVKPSLILGHDTGVTEKVRAAIKTLSSGSGRLIYLGTSSGGLISSGRIDLGSPTTNTEVATIISTAGTAKGTNMVEWLDFVWGYGYSTGTTPERLVKADNVDGSSLAAVSNPASGNLGIDLLVTKSFLYYCSAASVGRMTDASTLNATALTLQNPLRVRSLTTLGEYIIVGAAPYADETFSSLVRWDGVSNIIDGQAVIIPDTGLRVIRNFNGAVYIFCVPNQSNYGFRNVIRIYKWLGGDTVSLLHEIQLNNTATTSVDIFPGGVQASSGKLWFTISAPTANTMTKDNGIYSIDSFDRLNLEYVSTADSSDTLDVDNFFLRWIQGALYTIHLNGSNTRFSRISDLTYSATAPLVLPALQPDPTRRSRITRVRFATRALPASTSIAVSEKSDQASSFTAVKTFSTTGTKIARIEFGTEYVSQPFNHCQLKFLLAGASSAKPEIVGPIVVEGEVLDDYT